MHTAAAQAAAMRLVAMEIMNTRTWSGGGDSGGDEGGSEGGGIEDGGGVGSGGALDGAFGGAPGGAMGCGELTSGGEQGGGN